MPLYQKNPTVNVNSISVHLYEWSYEATNLTYSALNLSYHICIYVILVTFIFSVLYLCVCISFFGCCCIKTISFTRLRYLSMYLMSLRFSIIEKLWMYYFYYYIIIIIISVAVLSSSNSAYALQWKMPCHTINCKNVN